MTNDTDDDALLCEYLPKIHYALEALATSGFDSSIMKHAAETITRDGGTHALPNAYYALNILLSQRKLA